MAENEQSLQQSSIADRLISTHLARKSFAAAIDLASSFDYRSDQVRLNGYIGRCLAQAGFDPSAQLEFLEGIVATTKDKPEDERRPAVYAAARIYLADSNPGAALKTISLHRNVGKGSSSQPYTDLEIAKSFARLGQDPSPVLKGALLYIGATKDDYVKANDYISLAGAQYAIGVDHKHALAKAYSLTKRLGSMKPYFCVDLAKAYAQTGDLEMALQVVDQIQDKDPLLVSQKKNEALESVSKATLARGDIDAALEIAQKVGSNLFVAEIAAEGAISAVQNRRSAIALVHKALDYANRPLAEDGSSDFDKARQAEVLALIARGKYLNKQRHGWFFSKALEAAPTIKHELYRASVYNAVARNQALIGEDAKPTWRLAMDSVAEYVAYPETDSLDKAEAALTLEDFTKAQIECGYHDMAQETVEQMIKVESEDNSRYNELFKAEVLADIGLSRARKGLTTTELMSLPAGIIRQIMVGNNVTAKEAVAYFGLNK